jgi:hypothetical protein
MSALTPEDLRAMAEAIDAALEPRLHVDLDLSAEGVQRLTDLLEGVSAELDQRTGIETTWPVHRLLAALSAAADGGSPPPASHPPAHP